MPPTYDGLADLLASAPPETEAGGDLQVLSTSVAVRDACLPVAEHLSNLRSPLLHDWQPPGGGAAGALSHAVIRSLDIKVALDQPPVAPLEAVVAVLDQLKAAKGTWFGVDVNRGPARGCRHRLELGNG